MSRSESLLDYDHLASYLAIGAAVENISLCAEEMGFATHVDLFPLAWDPTLVCELTFEAWDGVTGERLLLDQIPRRVTNRRLAGRATIDESTIAALGQAATMRGGDVQFLRTAGELDAIGEILGRGDRVRFLSRQMHREMFGEIRWSPSEAERTRDGLDVATLELTATDLAAMRLTASFAVMAMVGKLGGGRGLQKPSEKAVAAAAAVGLITVPATSPEDYFCGGRAMQRLWLTASALGWALQPMTAITYLFSRIEHGGGRGLEPGELDELRRLRTHFMRLFRVQAGQGEPMLFRLARAASPTARSLRRPVSEVLAFTGGVL